MFDTVKVGKKIAELRKARNMTQFELADALGISFQAVSNWERGASMPDISKFPDLADLFGVTIDEILGKKNPVVERLARNETIDTRTVTPAEIEEAAALAKPRQLEKIVEDNLENLVSAATPEPEEKADTASGTGDGGEAESKSDTAGGTEDGAEDGDKASADSDTKSGAESGKASGATSDEANSAEPDQKSGAKPRYNAYDVLNTLLPYLSDKEINQLAREAASTGRNMDVFLQFLDEESVNVLAQKAFEKGGARALEAYLPFMYEKDVNKFAKKAFEESGTDALEAYLPFMSDSAIDDILKAAALRGDDIESLLPFATDGTIDDCVAEYVRAGRSIEPLLPFMNDFHKLAEVAELYIENGRDIEPLLPFMESSDFTGLAFDKYLAQGRDPAVLLPFLEEPEVARLARLVCKRDGLGALGEYLPFMSDADIRKLMAELMKD